MRIPTARTSNSAPTTACDICGRTLSGEPCSRHPWAGTLDLALANDRTHAQALRDLRSARTHRMAASGVAIAVIALYIWILPRGSRFVPGEQSLEWLLPFGIAVVGTLGALGIGLFRDLRERFLATGDAPEIANAATLLRRADQLDLMKGVALFFSADALLAALMPAVGADLDFMLAGPQALLVAALFAVAAVVSRQWARRLRQQSIDGVESPLDADTLSDHQQAPALVHADIGTATPAAAPHADAVAASPVHPDVRAAARGRS